MQKKKKKLICHSAASICIYGNNLWSLHKIKIWTLHSQRERQDWINICQNQESITQSVISLKKKNIFFLSISVQYSNEEWVKRKKKMSVAKNCTYFQWRKVKDL